MGRIESHMLASGGLGNHGLHPGGHLPKHQTRSILRVECGARHAGRRDGKAEATCSIHGGALRATSSAAKKLPATRNLARLPEYR